MIVATAGHVDHGKTSLVRALTGIDTDRLPEERKRGMTIELGFAYVDAFGGRVGFVDVPGHERLVHTMLVGASGIDAALLVVAADDGVMPQTREHLQILDLLGVHRIVAVVTKIDRVDSGRVDDVRASVRALLDETPMRGAPIVLASVPTGEGIAQIGAELERALAETRRRRPRDGAFRYAVDRVFTVAGAGTVVTGFVHAGRVAAGDSVSLWPDQRTIRIRGIRVDDRDASTANAGDRAALVLAGVEREAVRRGMWLLGDAGIVGTQRLVARLHPSSRLPPYRDWLRVHVHSASNHVLGRVHRFGPDDALCEVRLDEPLPLARGDRFVLRDDAATRTLGGGEVLDPEPPQRGVRREAYAAQRLTWYLPDTADDALKHACAQGSVIAIEPFRRAWNISAKDLPDRLQSAGMAVLPAPGGAVALSANALDAAHATTVDTVAAWHKANPHVQGMRAEQLRAVLRARLAPALVDAVAAHASERGALVREGGYFRLPEHRPRMSAEDERLWQRLAPLLRRNERPPVIVDLARTLVVELDAFTRALKRLAFAGYVVQVADNRVFATSHIEELMALARALDSDGTGFTAASFRDASRLGRNLAIDVLEHFDRTGFTLRRGDTRKVSRLDLFARSGMPAAR